MLWKKICKLIDVKTIMTLSLTFVFVRLSLETKITSDNFLNVFMIIVGFYFGTQHEKKGHLEEEVKNNGRTEMD